MSFGCVYGHDRIKKILRNVLFQGKHAHAYCFAGPGRVGKRQLAIEWAKALNCKEVLGDSCDQCKSCVQITHGNHPDVLIIEPKTSSIQIHQVRELQTAASFDPGSDVTRVVIVDQAESMTTQAANSLLKFLEEPPASTMAILLTENVYKILPTILSRCQILRFSHLPPGIMQQRLEKEGISSLRAEIFSQLSSEGQKAGDTLTESEIYELCEQIVRWGVDILSKESLALVMGQYAWLQEEMSLKREALVLDLLLLWLRQMLHARYKKQGTWKSQGAVLSVWRDTIQEQAYRLEPERLLHGLDTVLQARSNIPRALSPQSVLEQMVMKMQEGVFST